jgi:hypothetical protein
MKRLFVLLLLVAGLTTSRSSFAQGSCPPTDADGAWLGTFTLAFGASDGCIDTVYYCYRRVTCSPCPYGYKDEYYICGMALGPCPGSGHNTLGDEQLFHEGANAIFGTITDSPDCDGGVTYKVVQIAIASCYYVDGVNPIAVACGSGTCTRVCDYCWQWIGGYHVVNPTNCTYNDTYSSGCGSLPPGKTLFTVTSSGCYHLPCSYGW